MACLRDQQYNNTFIGTVRVGNNWVSELDLLSLNQAKYQGRNSLITVEITKNDQQIWVSEW